MFKSSFTDKRFLAFLAGLILIAGQFVFAPADSAYGEKGGAGSRSSGTTVLAFSSDVHNKNDDVSAERLAAWIDTVQGEYGKIDAMGFGGDLGDAGDGTNYWRNVRSVMDAVGRKGVASVYTTGNHEFNPGDAQYNNGALTSATGQSVVDRYKVGAEGREGDNYRIYCLGSTSTTQEYTYDQGVAMERYLGSVGNDKPIIVITHFPLHFCKGAIWGDRTTRYAENAINSLNNAVENGTPDDPTDDRTIIFLWGHNHSESDPYYDQIYTPGSSIEYAQGSTREIKFYYGAAGCMSDSEYSGGSEYVKGKGLVLQIGADDSVRFGYCNTEGTDVTEDGEYPELQEEEALLAGLDLDRKALSVTEGKTTRIKAVFDPVNATNKNLTWTSSDEDVAEVVPEETTGGSTAKIRGVAPGTAEITAVSEDGGLTAAAEVTVTEDGGEQYYVIRMSNYIMSSRRSSEMMSNDQGYEYHGLDYVNYRTGTTVPYDALWRIEPVDGVENGYRIINYDGEYLSATYENNEAGAKTGNLTVGSTEDVWIAENGLSNWQANGSTLKSVNAGKSLTITTGNEQKGFFTVRSSGGTIRLAVPDVTVEPVPVKSVTVEPSSLSVEAGKSAGVTAHVLPEEARDKSVTWSSSDDGIATVDQSGRIKGVAPGEATITVTTNDGGKTAACDVTVREKTSASSGYVISIGDFAMSTEPTDDEYISESNNAYHYQGLDGVPYDGSETPDEKFLWNITETNGGYYIQSLDGRYLNATYESNSEGGKTGVLKLDETKDVWTLQGGLDGWVVSGSTLRSTNCGKSLTHEEGTPAGSINVFTIRTTGETSHLTDPDNPGTFKYLVRFLDAYGNELKAAKYAAGETPAYDGETPVKEKDAQYTYTFAGWSDGTDTYGPEDPLPAVTNAATYTALFDAEEIHYHTYGDPEYEWTETDGGYSCKAALVCSGCDETTEGHEVSETVTASYAVTAEPDCEHAGTGVYTAAFEDERFAVQTKEVEITALGHDWKDATCTAPKTCTRCDATDGEPLGHDYGAWMKADDLQHQRVCSRDESHVEKEDHTWDEGTVTKAATATKDGVKTYKCTAEGCGAEKTEVIPKKGYKPGEDPNQKGKDGTAVGEGASAAAADKAITNMKSDKDLKGFVFAKLTLRSPKQTKTSVTIRWTRPAKAKKYVIYGNKCGKNKPKKIATVTGNVKTFKKVAGKKVRKGQYYKFLIVALDKNNCVVSTSRVIHVATKGGKVGNHKSVRVKKAILTKAKKLKKGKRLKLGAKMIPQSKKLRVRKHVALRYESTNKKIATVSAKGVIKARKKGTCFVYAFAQNGIFKKIKVTVR